MRMGPARHHASLKRSQSSWGFTGRGSGRDSGVSAASEEDTLAVWASLISAAFGLLAGGAATYFTTRAQLRVEAEHAYDRSLRDLRPRHYQRLFHLTRVMPREWLPSTIPARWTSSQFGSLRDWYFGEDSGGMFLSQPAREPSGDFPRSVFKFLSDTQAGELPRRLSMRPCGRLGPFGAWRPAGTRPRDGRDCPAHRPRRPLGASPVRLVPE
jgi:hypothetical protein